MNDSLEKERAEKEESAGKPLRINPNYAFGQPACWYDLYIILRRLGLSGEIQSSSITEARLPRFVADLRRVYAGDDPVILKAFDRLKAFLVEQKNGADRDSRPVAVEEKRRVPGTKKLRIVPSAPPLPSLDDASEALSLIRGQRAEGKVRMRDFSEGASTGSALREDVFTVLSFLEIKTEEDARRVGLNKGALSFCETYEFSPLGKGGIDWILFYKRIEPIIKNRTFLPEAVRLAFERLESYHQTLLAARDKARERAKDGLGQEALPAVEVRIAPEEAKDPAADLSFSGAPEMKAPVVLSLPRREPVRQEKRTREAAISPTGKHMLVLSVRWIVEAEGLSNKMIQKRWGKKEKTVRNMSAWEEIFDLGKRSKLYGFLQTCARGYPLFGWPMAFYHEERGDPYVDAPYAISKVGKAGLHPLFSRVAQELFALQDGQRDGLWKLAIVLQMPGWEVAKIVNGGESSLLPSPEAMRKLNWEGRLRAVYPRGQYKTLGCLLEDGKMPLTSPLGAGAKILQFNR